MRIRPTLIVAAAALGVAAPSAAASVEPQALAQARVIRAEVDARYRGVPGHRLAVTEATPTGIVDSLTLLAGVFDPPRVVPAGNGIYFAICPVGATCPYPARSAAWPTTAFLPRRQALELALRTFQETSVGLVVVALPTVRPVWLIFERDGLRGEVDASALLGRLGADPALVDRPLRDIVDRVTRPRLFLPIEIVRVSPSHVTLFAVSLFAP